MFERIFNTFILDRNEAWEQNTPINDCLFMVRLFINAHNLFNVIMCLVLVCYKN